MNVHADPKFAAAEQIVATLRAHGHMAYFAGGCVRDLLLGHMPKDFDVATSATPTEVTALFPKTFTVGAHFGVVLVLLDDIATEVATFRRDGDYTDGRRPDRVDFSTDPAEDVRRRDFTINGMLLDPAAASLEAGVLDYVNGRADLAARIVRAIGDPHARFAEDKLRMLRAIRFTARLHFALDPATATAIRTHAPDIAQVSAERIREEITRMLTEGNARTAFELLRETNLLAQVLPEATRMVGVQQPPQYHPEGDVWTHTMLLLEKLPAACSPTLGWGALLHDIGKPATFRAPALNSDGTTVRPNDRIRFDGHVEVGVRIAEDILRRLRFSTADTDQILALIKNHMRFGDVMHMKQSTLKRFFRLENFPEHLELHRLDASSAHNDLTLYHFAKEKFETAPAVDLRPPLLVGGRDLITAGYKPGPRFTEMLHFAEDAQLDGTVTTRAESLALLEKNFGPPPKP